jgi:hypothetical protein
MRVKSETVLSHPTATFAGATYANDVHIVLDHLSEQSYMMMLIWLCGSLV